MHEKFMHNIKKSQGNKFWYSYWAFFLEVIQYRLVLSERTLPNSCLFWPDSFMSPN